MSSPNPQSEIREVLNEQKEKFKKIIEGMKKTRTECFCNNTECKEKCGHSYNNALIDLLKKIK